MAEENEKAVLDRKAQEHEMNELKRRIHAAAEAIRSKLLSDAENRSFESELSDLKAKAESGDKDAATEYGWNLISGFATGTPDRKDGRSSRPRRTRVTRRRVFQVGIALPSGNRDSEERREGRGVHQALSRSRLPERDGALRPDAEGRERGREERARIRDVA